jgi:tryptophan-rich sensory protein
MDLAIVIALVVAAAMSGALFKPGAWYETLRKPSWTPPNWAFPVVWTILYLFIAIAGWLIWQGSGWSLALGLWGLQLVLNAAWSALFFGMRRMDLALVDVVALLAAILAFIVVALPVSLAAAMLFAPYALWVATASMLNFSVWRMNRSQAAA